MTDETIDAPSTEELAARLHEVDGRLQELLGMQQLAERVNGVQAVIEAAPLDESEDALWADFTASRPTRTPRSVGLPPMPSHAVNPKEFAAQAIGRAAQQIPDWNQYAEKVTARLQSNPAPLGQAFATGNPAAVDGVFADAYKVTKQIEMQAERAAERRLMKIQAQTMVGASGRPLGISGDAADWQQIVAAKPTSYWER